MQPKPEGYGDYFTAKCGHCNEIQVNSIHAQGNSAKLFALATKETMTYCRKCICLHCMFKKLLQAIIARTEKASGLLTGQQASKSAGLFISTVI